MCTNFQAKWTTLSFWTQICPKMDFGSNIVKDVAESWVEAEMSWVEVDGAGWRWVHDLVILNSHKLNILLELKLYLKVKYQVK